MKNFHTSSRLALAAGMIPLACGLLQFATATAFADDYKIVNSSQTMGTGGIDYVTADSDNRKLYVPRGSNVLVFDLDTLKPAGTIPGLKSGHGVAIDPKSGHAFSSSNPILMWDAKTLETIKTIPAQGRPDGILFEPLTESIWVLSHAAPNVTVINANDGSVLGTIDLGGSPEQAQSDGAGHVYIDLEDKDAIAVVDAKAMKMTGKYELAGKGGGPGGLGLDAKNNVLFAFCHEPAVCVVLSATDGKILTTLPIGSGTDGGGFNPNTMEAFSSQRDGTLTVIKETSPTTFEVEQTVQTKQGGKTCALDTKKDQIIVIAVERPATAPAAAASANPPAANAPQASAVSPASPGDGAPRRGFGRGGPGLLDIMAVGR